MSLDSMTSFLQTLIAAKLQSASEDIDLNSGYYELGLSSFMLMEIVQSIESEFSVSLSPILLFEYGSIKLLAEHLNEHLANEAVKFNLDNSKSPELGKAQLKQAQVVPANEQNPTPHSTRDIAVIGMAGKYPDAQNLNVFWENLKEGKNSVKTVPIERWDWRDFEDFTSPSGKNISKWGGFIDDPYCFDARFFRVTPKDAQMLDPQERLFLEVCWEAIEDAGYTPKNIVSANADGGVRRVGVFVGVMHKDYSSIGAEALQQGENITLSLSSASIANRVSYFCNFHGPSLAVDTLCSSSLTAVHMAIQSILNGESQVAIAGGVNLSLHPDKYRTYGMMDMHSSDGLCRSFGEGGDGYVSSEGIGSLILKPLDDAVRDKDHIYAVIKASSVNHVGKASGITVPEPVMQSNVIKDCLEKANIDAQSISYIEAHGTGTSLGDPIEVEGLIRAFNHSDTRTQYCALGSVKSNIGHAESAAGISGLTKTILQLHHRTLVPSLHAEITNPYLDLKSTPFFVQGKTENWQLAKGYGEVRRAGVSSFGATGANTHIILEEYCDTPNFEAQERKHPLLIPISAKNTERLTCYIQRIISYLESKAGSNISLSSLAYTLQRGREAMDERLIVLVNSSENSVDEFVQLLHRVVSEPALPTNSWRANTKVDKGRMQLFDSDEDLEEFTRQWINQGKWEKIAKMWAQGYDINWDQFPKMSNDKRISLPTYPFEKENFAISRTQGTAKLSQKAAVRSQQGTLLLEPLWVKKPFRNSDLKNNVPSYYKKRYLLLFDSASSLVQQLSTELDNVEILSVNLHSNSGQEQSAEHFNQLALELFEQVKGIISNKQKGKVCIQVLLQNTKSAPWLSALSGVLKTAHLENPNLIGQIIENESNDAAVLNQMLQTDALHPQDDHIRYRSGAREILEWSELAFEADHNNNLDLPWSDNGVYLITGGVGGLGLIFAREIAKQTSQANIVLVGRSSLSTSRQAEICALEALGARVLYCAADIADKNAVVELIEKIQSDFGKLNGIIHSAGVIQDNFIMKKSLDEVSKVLAPKVQGSVNLDQVTQSMELDFFLLFSSAAGALGNAGQADYSTANAFMDAYAHYRNDLVLKQQRYGKTLSINWPLWKEGGMQVDSETESWMRNVTGMVPMETSTGIQALYQSFGSKMNQTMVLSGDLERLRNTISTTLIDDYEIAGTEASLQDKELLLEKTLHQFKVLFGEVTHFSLETIDVKETLENYGIDSIMIMGLNQKLQQVFSNISKTLFYEYQTLEALAEYFVDDYFQDCCKWTGFVTGAVQSNVSTQINGSIKQRQVEHETEDANVVTNHADTGSDPIAIIGINGRYPKSNNLEQYWENLQSGKNCITEIPGERWSLDGFFHANAEEAVKQGKSYSKWGGFIDGFANFDPLFFNISPREAFSMDPQERIFLESCWSVFEGAGYTKEKLAQRHQGRVGIFAGITKTGFSLYGPELWRQGENVMAPQTSFSSLANRISYFLDLSGPSITIDTMCSASLTAIHEACEHIHRQECELAVAGGVNLYLHPSNYVALSKHKMLSKDGRCKSFGQGANGFVPGEGVGTILLKPLSKAKADGDKIYAVIRGTSINHGGKTHGYTVPNPGRQAELIRKALDKSEVNARVVSYIEAHGTGTELGDPIEITGLKKAFTQDTCDTEFCAIGSVKSNIGHLEAAAGIAGVTKIVLQMQHKKLVPSLHAEIHNPNIDFSKTPFVVQKGLNDWHQPRVTIKGKSQQYPRIAGISSFGAGGSNAHIIIEEFECEETNLVADGSSPSDLPQLIVLSAKSQARLKDVVSHLNKYLMANELSASALRSLAYTLQTGREAMEVRLAVLVHSVQELTDKLTTYLSTNQASENLYIGKVAANKGGLGSFSSDNDVKETITHWSQQKEYSKLLKYWVGGLAIDWHQLYLNDKTPQIMDLPTYPFTKDRFWFDHKQLATSPVVETPLVLTTALARNENSISNKASPDKPVNVQLRILDDLSGADIPVADTAKKGDTARVLQSKEEPHAINQLPLQSKKNSSVTIMTTNLEQELIDSLAKTLFINAEDVDIDKQFIDMGLDSIIGVEWIGAINKQYGCAVAATKVYDYPTIREITGFLEKTIFENTATPKDEKAIEALEIAAVDKSSSVDEQASSTQKDEFIAKQRLTEELITSFADILLMAPGDVDVDRQFIDMGLDSIISVEWIGAINKQYGCSISATRVYDYQTITEMAGFLEKIIFQKAVTPKSENSIEALQIAVVEKSSSVDAKAASAKVGEFIAEETLTEALITSFADVLLMAPGDVDVDRQFIDMGLDSIISVEWIGAINKQYGCAIAATKVYDYTTIREFSRYLRTLLPFKNAELKAVDNTVRVKDVKGGQEEKVSQESENVKNSDSANIVKTQSDGSSAQSKDSKNKIAIVGMSGKYPGASNLAQFWDNLAEGTNSIQEVPSSRWDVEQYFDTDPETPGKTYCKWIGLLDDVDCFDPLFFMISPAEAEMMDPQHRLFLQESYRAFEDAGYSAASLNKEKCGVYLGIGNSEYGAMLNRAQTSTLNTTGNSSAIAAARIAYHLNLKGPAIAIDTACSSSLVATHLACQALKSGEIDMALAGGVSIYLMPESYVAMSGAGMLSPEGQCNSFDNNANGFVPGEGVGTLILKRLEDAQAQGDHIYGVILDSGVNQDGKTNGITAPSTISQTELGRDLYDKNNIDPQSISYVEMHGTGTKLGDPIELDALSTVFREKSSERQFCAVGSVKSNIGHTSWAAGIAGVHKVLLSMQHKTLVPTLNYSTPNQHFDFADSPFYVNTQTKPWASDNGSPLRAGVSSFGFSGTNAHLVLEEYRNKPADLQCSTMGQVYLFVLSAKNSDRLKDVITNLMTYLGQFRDISASKMQSIAYTLQVGREAMAERLALVVNSKSDLEAKLQAVLKGQFDQQDTFSAQVNQHRDFLASFKKQGNYLESIDTWLKEKQYQKLLELWVKGGDIDWHKLYGENKPQRVSLPTYPFGMKRFWIDSYLSTPKQTAKEPTDNKISGQQANNRRTDLASVSVWDSSFMKKAQSYQGQEVKTEIIDDQIAIVRMEDRQSKNMFSEALQLGLQKAISGIQHNKNIKVLILTGYDNLFCMGGTKDGMLDIANKKHSYTDAPFLYRGLLELDIPVISAMQGHAFGGGLTLGLYADICLMAEESVYSANFMKYGFTPGMGATYILGEKLGNNLAIEMMFTAKHFDGKMLKERGATVNICRQASVLNEALRIARELSKKPRNSLRVLKKEMSGRVLNELLKHVDSEVDMHEETFSTDLVKEAIEDHFARTSTAKTSSPDMTIAEQSNNQGIVKLSDIDDKPQESHLQGSVPHTSTLATISLRHLDPGVEAQNIQKPAVKNVVAPASANIVPKMTPITEKVAKVLQDALHLDADVLDNGSTFQELGVDSIASVQIIRKLNQEFALDLESATLYDHFDIAKLSRYIASILPATNTEQIDLLPELSITDTESKIEVSGSFDDNQEIRETIKKILVKKLHLETEEFSDALTFQEMGVDSIASVQIIREVNRTFNIDAESMALYDYCNLSEFSQFISGLIKKYDFVDEKEIVQQPKKSTQVQLKAPISLAQPGNSEALNHDEKPLSDQMSGVQDISTLKVSDKSSQALGDIAIIGVAGRFPGASNVSEFWQNIEHGVNNITEVPARKWQQQSGEQKQWIGALDDEDKFDAEFFNISPREAQLMDPQQRVFLENSWHAFEDAGYSPETLSGKACGVFVGVGQGDYVNKSGMIMAPQTLLGNAPSILASRIAYYLNLSGPCVAIDTACSSSLSAIHLACQSLKQGECELALAGGVHIVTTPSLMSVAGEMGLLSESGRCKTFDNAADGWVVSEGVGTIVLKPLQQAIADNDTIHGVIKATGINQNGKSNGIASPKPSAQAHLQKSIYDKAQINPGTIGYMEVQGASDKVGDAIEIKGLIESFSAGTSQKNFCALGSLKPNIGHPLLASGIACVIKTLLAIKNKKIPAISTVDNINDGIKLDNSPFYINSETKEWTPSNGQARRAAVNGFGMSGTNAHIVIDEYVVSGKDVISNKNEKPQLIILSAKTQSQVNTMVRNLKQDLTVSDRLANQNIEDIAYTLQVGRQVMANKVAFVVTGIAQLVQTFEQYLKSVESKNSSDVENCYKGSDQQNSSEIKELLDGGTGKVLLGAAIEEQDLKKLAFYWVNGVEIPWTLLHQETLPQRISLPNYPFKKTRHWIENVADEQINKKMEAPFAAVAKLENEQRVIAIIAGVLGLDASDLALDKHLEHYGYDSILSLQLLQKLQVYVNPNVDANQLFSCRKIQEIIDLFPSQEIIAQVKSELQKPALPHFIFLEKYPELIHLNNCTEGTPVFWFHGGLGGVELYREIASQCKRPFYGIQAKGWMTDREPLHGIQAMVAYYLHIIQSIQPEGPYDLGGYSLGGMIAYEAARQLQEFGHQVNSIVMLDTMDSSVLKQTSVEAKTAMLQAVNIALEACITEGEKSSADILIHGSEVSSTLSDKEFLNELITLAKERGLKKSDAQIRKSIEKSFKVQLAYEAHRFSILPLPAPSTVNCHYFRNNSGVFWGDMEPYFTLQGHGLSIDPEYAWKEWEVVCPNFNLIELDTENHLTLLREPQIAKLIVNYCRDLYRITGAKVKSALEVI